MWNLKVKTKTQKITNITEYQQQKEVWQTSKENLFSQKIKKKYLLQNDPILGLLVTNIRNMTKLALSHKNSN